jgi:hypothetical protein
MSDNIGKPLYELAEPMAERLHIKLGMSAADCVAHVLVYLEELDARVRRLEAVVVAPPGMHAMFDCADNQDCDASCPTCEGTFTAQEKP